MDIIALLDVSDEHYTADNIDRIIAFVERTPLVCWYRLSPKNYVFDDRTYLVRAVPAAAHLEDSLQ